MYCRLSALSLLHAFNFWLFSYFFFIFFKRVLRLPKFLSKFMSFNLWCYVCDVSEVVTIDATKLWVNLIICLHCFLFRRAAGSGGSKLGNIFSEKSASSNSMNGPLNSSVSFKYKNNSNVSRRGSTNKQTEKSANDSSMSIIYQDSIQLFQ